MTTDVFASPVTSPVETLVGADKKFKTVEDLAKGKIEADAFIESLQKELKGVREIAEERVHAETELQKLRDELKALRENKSPVAEPREPTAPALTTTDVKSLVEATITERETVKTAEDNIREANQRMVEIYGTPEAARNHLEAKAKELGVGVQWLKDTAAKSPKGFLELMGAKAPPVQDNFLAGSKNPDALRAAPNGQAPREGTKEFFDKMRRENPAKWLSQETQLEIHKAHLDGKYFKQG